MAALLVLLPAFAHGQGRRRHQVAAVDSILQRSLIDGKIAGLSAIVVRGRDTLLMKAYGSADLALGVPTPTDAVYQVGSITKQFTAAAILRLAEEGKLSLDDEVSLYVPAFIAPGRHVRLRQLLDHTSGTFDYLSLNGFLRRARIAVPHDSVVTLFSAELPEFDAGSAMAYSNSGYFLLGMVVERVSGLAYEEYVRQFLFAAAGLRATHFCSTDRVVPRAVHGYDTIDGELRHARFIDFSWIYAAGAICSTTGDLIAWTNALHGGRILGASAYRQMIGADTLADGTRLRYAKGLAVDSILGHRAIHHGGDITGFTSELTWLPDDSLAVVVLINSQGGVRPDALTMEMLRVLIEDRSPTIRTLSGSASEFVGEFAGSGHASRIRIGVDSTGESLTARINDGQTRTLTYLGGGTFARGDTRYTFFRRQNRIMELRFDNVYDVTATVRVDRAP